MHSLLIFFSRFRYAEKTAFNDIGECVRQIRNSQIFFETLLSFLIGQHFQFTRDDDIATAKR